MIVENMDIYDLVPSQIRKLIDKLNNALEVVKGRKQTTSKVASFEKTKHHCPYCNSEHFIKYGHKDGIQNYQCKNCRRKFNDLTGTIFAGTHLSYEQIEIFINCHNDKVSIRKTAERMKVNKNTVHLLRLKMLDALKEIRGNVQLTGEIESDEIYKSINLKGTRPEKMPRASKPRASKGTTTRGISKHKVCIASAVDENDNMFLEIAGTGPITSKMVETTLTPKIKSVKKIITDSKSSYESEAIKNHWNLKQIKSKYYTDEEGNSLANINSVHSGLTTFLAPFKGVSTKHLQGYLDWYVFDKYLNYSIVESKKINEILKYSVDNNTIIINSNMYNNYSGLDFKEIYSDYAYTPPTLI